MNQEPQRTSIWSVPEGWLTAYFLLFTVQFFAGVSFVVWYETAVITRDSEAETLANILWRAGVIPILSASTSYIFVEGGRLTMVIANWVEKKLEERRIKREQMLIEQGREQGRKEGIELGREQGREEGIELGRAYERERIANGNTDDNDDNDPTHSENGR